MWLHVFSRARRQIDTGTEFLTGDMTARFSCSNTHSQTRIHTYTIPAHKHEYKRKHACRHIHLIHPHSHMEESHREDNARPTRSWMELRFEFSTWFEGLMCFLISLSAIRIIMWYSLSNIWIFTKIIIIIIMIQRLITKLRTESSDAEEYI